MHQNSCSSQRKWRVKDRMPEDPELGRRDFELRAAVFADLEPIRSLLREGELPTLGVDLRLIGGMAVAMRGSRLVGCAAIERLGDGLALLRSVAVRPELRGQGVGSGLVRDRMVWARSHGIEAVFLLTTSGRVFFGRLGFLPTERNELPEVVRQHPQATTSCPESAVSMVGRPQEMVSARTRAIRALSALAVIAAIATALLGSSRPGLAGPKPAAPSAVQADAGSSASPASCLPIECFSKCSPVSGTSDASCSSAVVTGSDPAAGLEARRGPTPGDRGLRDLEPVLEPVRAFYRVPAIAVAVVQGGKLSAIGAVGARAAGSTKPVELGDKWHIGSCGKAFTATAAAVLVEKGRIEWSTRLFDVFRELRGQIRTTYADATLRQLLAHRAGYAARDSGFDRAVDRFTGPVPDQRLRAVRLASSQPAIAPPGDVFQYSDVGYTVVGSMLERAASNSWEQIVLENVAVPLDLPSLGFGAPGTEGSIDQPRGHVDVEGRLEALGVGPGQDLANPVIGPAGTIHLSIEDWARFAAVHLAGARGEITGYLEPGTFRELHTDDQAQGYGLGWGLATNPWGEGGALVHTGSCGAWAAAIWILPEANLAIVAASNYGGAFEAIGVAIDRVMQDIAGS